MRGCIAIFLFVFFVGPLLFAFEATAAASTFLANREFYSNALASPEIYTALLEGMLDDANVSGRLRETGEFDRIIETVNSAEWQAAVDDIVDQVIAVIEGRTNQVTISIPLAPVKAVLESSAGEQFLRGYLADLRACRPGQEPTSLAANANLSGLPLPVCVPEATTRAEYIDLQMAELPGLIERMPSHLTFSEQWDNPPQIEGFAWGSLQGAIYAAVAVLGVFAVSSWLVTGIVGGETAGARLRLLGGMLLLPSVAVALIGLMIGGAAAMRTSNIGPITDMSDALAETLYTAVTGSVGRISASFLAAGSIPAVIGAVLLVAGLIAPSARRDDLQRDLYANPTADYPAKPKNDFDVFHKPKNDNKPKNDDVIRPL